MFYSRSTYSVGRLFIFIIILLHQIDLYAIDQKEYFSKTLTQLIQNVWQIKNVLIKLSFEYVKHNENIRDIQLLKLDYDSFITKLTFDDNHSVEVSGQYNMYSKFVITTRFLTKGHTIDSNDLREYQFHLKKPVVHENSFSSMSDLIGMEVVNDIHAYTLIKKHDIKLSTVIKIDDQVSIIYQDKNLQIKSIGIALNSGAVGDNIKIKNIGTEVIFSGVIKDRNTVTVNLDQ